MIQTRFRDHCGGPIIFLDPFTYVISTNLHKVGVNRPLFMDKETEVPGGYVSFSRHVANQQWGQIPTAARSQWELILSDVS